MSWNILFNDAAKCRKIPLKVVVGSSKVKEKHRNVKKKKKRYTGDKKRAEWQEPLLHIKQCWLEELSEDWKAPEQEQCDGKS